MTDTKHTTDVLEQQETENEVAARALIFQSKDINELLVDTPWGTPVLIRALSGAERCEYFAFNAWARKEFGSKAAFYQHVMFEQVRLGCVHPKTKKRIFQQGDMGTLLEEHNGAILEELAELVREVSLLNGEVTENAKKKLQKARNSIGIANSQPASDTNA